MEKTNTYTEQEFKLMEQILLSLNSHIKAKAPFVFVLNTTDAPAEPCGCGKKHRQFEHDFYHSPGGVLKRTPDDVAASPWLMHRLAESFVHRGIKEFSLVAHSGGTGIFTTNVDRPTVKTSFHDQTCASLRHFMREARTARLAAKYDAPVYIASSTPIAKPDKAPTATGTPMFNKVYSQLPAHQQKLIDRLTIDSSVVCLRPGKRFGSIMTVKSVTARQGFCIEIMLNNGEINSDKVMFRTDESTLTVAPIKLERAADGVKVPKVFADGHGVLGFECPFSYGMGNSRYALLAS